MIDEDGAYCSLVGYVSSLKAIVVGGEVTLTVETEVRYLNDEWRHGSGLASIGSRESRRANTRKHNVFIRDARAKRDELNLDVNGFVLVDHVSAVANFGDEPTTLDLKKLGGVEVKEDLLSGKRVDNRKVVLSSHDIAWLT